MFPSTHALLLSLPDTGLRDFLITTHLEARDRETDTNPETFCHSYFPNEHTWCLKEALLHSPITSPPPKSANREGGGCTYNITTALLHLLVPVTQGPRQEPLSLNNTYMLWLFVCFTPFFPQPVRAHSKHPPESNTLLISEIFANFTFTSSFSLALISSHL